MRYIHRVFMTATEMVSEIFRELRRNWDKSKRWDATRCGSIRALYHSSMMRDMMWRIIIRLHHVMERIRIW